MEFNEEIYGICPYSGKEEALFVTFTVEESEEIPKKKSFTCDVAKLYHCRSGNSCPVFKGIG